MYALVSPPRIIIDYVKNPRVLVKKFPHPPTLTPYSGGGGRGGGAHEVTILLTNMIVLFRVMNCISRCVKKNNNIKIAEVEDFGWQENFSSTY